MKFKKSLLGNMISMAITTSVLATAAHAQQITIDDPSQLRAASNAIYTSKKSTGQYIVQLKGASGIARASELGELIPSNQLVALARNNYNADSPTMAAYTAALRSRQEEVASQIGNFEILNSYAHTFNGFSAKMTEAQAEALRNHPDVVAVYDDEVQQPQTANTPAFLGLTGPGGNHTIGNKGEGVVVGILDSGIWPENPSYADDGTYSDPADLGWTGTCDAGDEAGAAEDGTDTFNCNNKLIGARFYNTSFKNTYDVRYDLGEFESPRDADGHGSHTSSTAAGNEGVTATRGGVELGTVSGIAPRARVAMYKVCWNANYVSPAGVRERGCFFGDSMAAIDQAVVDGVDVLNYSIGNVTGLNSPVYNAALSAAEAGVFFAGSAGNDGPGPATVSNIAPWVTTVAASTYDGTVPVVGEELAVSIDDAASAPIFSIEGSITAEAPEAFSGDLAVTVPANACAPLTNPEAIAGQVALIARGTCNFSDKILNAQNAGATGVVVYSDNRTPLAMGGDGTGITIPGRMITNEDGLALAEASVASTVTVTWSDVGITIEDEVQGNLMADFSSRGVNPQTNDIIKPDITAPGVQILAANSEDQLDFGGNEDGQPFHYLQGTSMSSPHIAGMAALLREQRPDWSPAQIKSALMTSARQNLTNQAGTIAAGPFDFGAGHADPVPAMNPGLTYDANLKDYLAFLCGQGEANLVAGQLEGGCASLVDEGFATDASQLNYPSIAIGNLVAEETISRTVTDVTGAGGTYTVSVEEPAGINIEVKTFDSAGVETPSDDLVVEANGKASYSLTFTKGEGFVPEQFVFGAITLTGTDGTEVRSPIGVNPEADVKIEVPASLSLTLNRGRASFPVRSQYTGRTSLDYAGLTAPFALRGTVVNANGAAFDFGTAIGLGQFDILPIPEGTKVARFALTDGLVNVEGADLDLHVWNCIAFSCNPVASSESGSSNEEVLLVNPEPRSGAGGDVYVVLVHGFSTGSEDSADFISPTWIVNGAESTTRVRGSSRAVKGRFNNIRLTTSGLDANTLYMGGVTFYNDEGVAEGTTVLEVLLPEEN